MGAGDLNRRTFLGAAAAAVACGRDGLPAPSGPCGEDLPGALFLGTRPFVDEPEKDLEVKSGTGLDARYAVDLEALTADTLVTPIDRFYLRTGAPTDLGDPAGWTVRIGGRVLAERVLAIDELLAQVQPIGVLMFECSGNGDGSRFGLMSAGDFAGVPLSWVLDQVEPADDAALVQITGRDTHPPSTFSTAGASWIYTPEDLAEAWLVTHQDGEPITADHGQPVRLVVPGWYGCTNLKWVEEIRWVTDDEPATSQMIEFASRTHQDGIPELARDYRPAAIEVSAMAVRVEAWELDGEPIFRVIGVVWGGREAPDVLRLWMDDEDLGPVEVCGERDVRTWGLWQAYLPSGVQGTVTLWLTAEGVPARRLDARYYDRRVDLG